MNEVEVEMTRQSVPQKPLLAELRELEIGQSLTVPASRSAYLKAICSNYGFEWGKRFKTANNRAERTVTATRVE